MKNLSSVVLWKPPQSTIPREGWRQAVPKTPTTSLSSLYYLSKKISKRSEDKCLCAGCCKAKHLLSIWMPVSHMNFNYSFRYVSPRAQSVSGYKSAAHTPDPEPNADISSVRFDGSGIGVIDRARGPENNTNSQARHPVAPSMAEHLHSTCQLFTPRVTCKYFSNPGESSHGHVSYYVLGKIEEKLWVYMCVCVCVVRMYVHVMLESCS